MGFLAAATVQFAGVALFHLQERKLGVTINGALFMGAAFLCLGGSYLFLQQDGG